MVLPQGNGNQNGIAFEILVKDTNANFVLGNPTWSIPTPVNYPQSNSPQPNPNPTHFIFKSKQLTWQK